MGDPKKPRKQYSTPRHPWRSEQLSRELHLIGIYGLRNKHELQRSQTQLSKIRQRARIILGTKATYTSTAQVQKEEAEFLTHLMRIGLIHEATTIDDVLGLSIEEILDRRLQTIVVKKEISSSPHQARQMIIHGHIAIGDRVSTIPGITVESKDEDKVRIREDSPMIKQISAPKSAE